MLKKVWRHWTKSKNPESPRFRRDMAEKIAGKHIKYVTERHGDDIEEVIAKDGGMMIRGDEFLVFASQNIIMRCRIEEMKAWELLSNDGVVITAPDIEHGGGERTIIVHYVYYR